MTMRCQWEGIFAWRGQQLVFVGWMCELCGETRPE
jgi:hypothetical protein